MSVSFRCVGVAGVAGVARRIKEYEMRGCGCGLELGETVSEVKGYAVHCTVCGMRKKPIGRSAPIESENGLCGYDCEGYKQDPFPGNLWPGETAEDLGYPCSDPTGRLWDPK